jgi:peptidoglycan/LPS O-acetylase OafA/YrhL
VNLFKLEIDPNRIYGLDIIRATAILAVVFDHSALILYHPYYKYFRLDGVSIFLVLSGFLIGGILIKILEQNTRPDFYVLFDFWKRRWYRTLPNYFLILILLTLLSLLFNEGFNPLHVWRYFFFLQNFNTPHPFDFFPEAWSLSIEEWFYLVIPVFVFSLIRGLQWSVKKSIVTTAVVILIFSCCFRYFRYLNLSIHTLEEWDLALRRQVITRMDSLMIGVLASYARHYCRPFWLKWKRLFFIPGIFMLLGLHVTVLTESYDFDVFFCVFYFPLYAVSVALMLPLLSELKSGAGFLYKSITYVSLSSYSMYLINLSLVQGWIISSIPFDLESPVIILFRYFLYWAITVGGSILLYKFFEKPWMNRREKHAA